MGQEQSQLNASGEPEVEVEDDDSELPELSAIDTPPESVALYTEGDWDYLNTGNKIRALNGGKTFFTFACKVGTLLSDQERKLIDLVINLSSFDDEEKANNVPFVNIFDEEEAALYSIILVKTSYMLPHTDLSRFTPEFLATPEYHTCCEPGNPVIHESPDETTFRLTKTVIPYVYDLTIQMKVSPITGVNLERLVAVDHVMPSHALLLERTKRNPTVIDATRKCKSALIYYEVPGGVLCTLLTAVLNTQLPGFIAPFLEQLGYYGSKEAADTATLTRAYLRNNPLTGGPAPSVGGESNYQDTKSQPDSISTTSDATGKDISGLTKSGEKSDEDDDEFEDADEEIEKN